MQTLNAPMYEVNPASDFYKGKFAERQYDIEVSKIIDELATELGFDAKEFLYYGPFGFGFYGSSEGFKTFKEHLTKNSDRNGVYRFKKASKIYKTISERMLTVREVQKSAFAAHHVFGTNNLKASQWLDDRLFYEVKDAEITERAIERRKEREQEGVEPVMNISYKDYLKLVMERMDEKEGIA